MRWVRYEVGGEASYGILEGDDVEEDTGSPFVAYSRIGKHRPLDSCRLLVPTVPRNFYAAGLNYRNHLKAADPLLGLTEDSLHSKPDIGYRATSALIPHNDPIVIPEDATEKVQYEGELVVVIGSRAKHLSQDEASSCILGYTIGNDVSERTWQSQDATLWRSKNTDTFKPMGPWIETDADPMNMQTTVRLNGSISSEFDTSNMIFGISTYIGAMTRYLTLFPVDVIWMGTGGATDNIKAGDVVEIEISGIGVLKNPVEEVTSIGV